MGVVGPVGNRHSIRWARWDYTWPGWYFITICAHRRMQLFGTLSSGEVHLNALGAVLEDEWRNLVHAHPAVRLDEHVVMPTHFHGLIAIERQPEPVDPARHSLGALVCRFKSGSARRINEARGTPGTEVFLRNYFDRVIRTEEELAAKRLYIRTNPLRNHHHWWDEYDEHTDWI